MANINELKELAYLMKTDYRLRPYLPKEIEEGTYHCPHCKGRGKVLRAIYYQEGMVGPPNDYEVVDCYNCHGLGLLKIPQEFE